MGEYLHMKFKFKIGDKITFVRDFQKSTNDSDFQDKYYGYFIRNIGQLVECGFHDRESDNFICNATYGREYIMLENKWEAICI